MVDLTHEFQRRISIAPVGQLLVRKTGGSQYKSSYANALDHGKYGTPGG
jgi:hypothetical protein